LASQLSQDDLPCVHEVFSAHLVALVLKHLESYEVRILRVLAEVVKLKLGCLEPAISIVNQPGWNVLENLKLILNMVKVPF